MTSLSSIVKETTTPRRQWLLFALGLFVILGGALLLAMAVVLFRETRLLGGAAAVLGLNSKTPWYFSRSAGTVAYLLLAGSTIWGLLLSTRIIKEGVPPVLALAMHNLLSWLAIALSALHALALLLDSYYTYTLADLAIPFIGPYRPGWVGMGILGLYLMFVTSLSFNLRKQIGQKRWRSLHYLTFVAFVLVTVHGVMAGTDSSNTGMRAVYWGSGLVVLFLTNYRLLTAARGRRA